MEEIWKDIEGFENYYQISNLGRVRSLDRTVEQKNRYGTTNLRCLKGKMLHLCKDRNGYLHIVLYKNKFKKICRVHQLVAYAFIENTDNKPQINHIDGNKENNRVENLDAIDFYAVMNMSFNDYRNVFGDNLDTYIRFTEAFICDEDAGPHKTLKYLLTIPK